jgi:hypothetical protein
MPEGESEDVRIGVLFSVEGHAGVTSCELGKGRWDWQWMVGVY